MKNFFLLAESQRQRRFWRKPHIKRSFRSGGVVTWLHKQTNKQTNKQTDILILLIYRGYIGDIRIRIGDSSISTF